MSRNSYDAYGSCGAITRELLICLERARENQPYYEVRIDPRQNRHIASDVGLKDRVRGGMFRR